MLLVHDKRKRRAGTGLRVILAIYLTSSALAANGSVPDTWQDDLNPLPASSWNQDTAAHLLERAGFGGTPEQIQALFELGVRDAVEQLVHFDRAGGTSALPFDHSGVHDPGLEPFPPSRPATTELAKRTGEALGIKVKPEGNRRLQPVVNKFFYWLRASRLETERVAYWWANRMLTTESPLQEKMALFWHGHYAISEGKVRDYRKLLQELELFHAMGTGNFQELMLAVAKDPQCWRFLMPE